MSRSVPNFNFLAPLVTVIWSHWRGSQNKKSESCLFHQTPPNGQTFTWSYSTCKCLSAYQISTSYSSNSFRDKEGVPKFNVGLLLPCRTRYGETFVCAPSTWQDKTACQISASYHAVVFPIGFPLHVPNWGGFFGGWGLRCKKNIVF